jgi:hypothetical protein
VIFYSFHGVQFVCLHLGISIAGGTEDRETPCWRTVKCRVLVAGRHDVTDVLEYDKDCGNTTAASPTCILTPLSFWNHFCCAPSTVNMEEAITDSTLDVDVVEPPAARSKPDREELLIKVVCARGNLEANDAAYRGGMCRLIIRWQDRRSTNSGTRLLEAHQRRSAPQGANKASFVLG